MNKLLITLFLLFPLYATAKHDDYYVDSKNTQKEESAWRAFAVSFLVATGINAIPQLPTPASVVIGGIAAPCTNIVIGDLSTKERSLTAQKAATLAGTVIGIGVGWIIKGAINNNSRGGGAGR